MVIKAFACLYCFASHACIRMQEMPRYLEPCQCPRMPRITISIPMQAQCQMPIGIFCASSAPNDRPLEAVEDTTVSPRKHFAVVAMSTPSYALLALAQDLVQ